MKTKLISFMLLLAAVTSCKKNTKTDPGTPIYPTDGLVSYFNFDDNLKDQQGYTNDGVNTGNATFETGKAGKAVVLNGTDQKIVFSLNSAKTSTSISIVCWFKTTDMINIPFIGGDVPFYLNASSTNVGFGIKNSVNTHFVCNSSDWTHVAGTFDGTDMKLYINGVLADTNNSPKSISGFDKELVLGCYSYNNFPIYWAGSIDDLFIYNRALSQAEVSRLYNLHK
jgi:Concanavalin A-like lectin/glucanases superfamily